MRYVAAYLLAALSGNESPSKEDVAKILESIGLDVDDARLSMVWQCDRVSILTQIYVDVGLRISILTQIYVGMGLHLEMFYRTTYCRTVLECVYTAHSTVYVWPASSLQNAQNGEVWYGAEQQFTYYRW